MINNCKKKLLNVFVENDMNFIKEKISEVFIKRNGKEIIFDLK